MEEEKPELTDQELTKKERKPVLTRVQRKRYRRQAIQAAYYLIISVLLIFGIPAVIKLWQGLSINEFDKAMLVLNACAVIVQNCLMFATHALENLERVRIRVQRKSKLNKRKERKEVKALDCQTKS